MQDQNTDKHIDSLDDEIDLRELFKALSNGKWIILFITGLVSIIGVIYSLLLPDIYESKATLVPVTASSAISGSLGRYSGLAGFAGINIPTSADEGNSAKAIKKISSLSFFENNILPNIFLPDLMAVKSWNFKTNTINYDENIYNKESNKWVRDYSYPKQQVPTSQESFNVFLSKHINLKEDQKTGFITLSVKHQSPYRAKEWTELIINEVDTFYRQKDKLESEKAVSYLNKQIEKTGLAEIKQLIAELLQEETQKLTLIEANKNYVFEYIDPPAVMEQKSEPNRTIICILIALLGAILGVLFVVFQHYAFSKKDYVS